MFYVYILYSEKDDGLYIGRTNDLKRRLSEHRSGRVQSMRSRRPLRFLKAFEVESEKESIRVEREYKKGYKREELRRELLN